MLFTICRYAHSILNRKQWTKNLSQNQPKQLDFLLLLKEKFNYTALRHEENKLEILLILCGQLLRTEGIIEELQFFSLETLIFALEEDDKLLRALSTEQASFYFYSSFKDIAMCNQKANFICTLVKISC